MKKLLLIFLIIIPNLILGVTFYNNDLTFGSQDIDDNVSINFSGLGFSGVIRGDSAFSRFKIQESGGPETDLVFKNTQGRVPYAGANGYATATDGLFFDAGNVRLGVNSAVPTETLDVIGNAKVSNSIQNKITIYEHATKPAAPSAGYTKNYYKADGKYYALTAGDVETEIAGADGGAAGEFNYIDPNGDAELLTTYGWACTGNLSIASATTTQLFGSGYFTITAAATSADDYCAYDFDLDGGDTSAMLSSIVERIRTGAGFDTEDASIRLYDLDEAKYVNNNSKIYASSIGQPHTAGFQTHATHTNYEWRIVSNVDTTFTFDFDNAKLQRQGANKGVPSTDWKDFTPVWTNDTAMSLVVDFAQWRQQGPNIQINLMIHATGNGTDAANFLMDLPNSLAHKTDLVANTISAYGSGTFYDSSVTVYDPLNFWLSGTVQIGFKSKDLSFIRGTEVDSGDYFSIFAEIPIAGWQAEADMSSTTLNREIFSRYTSNAGTQAFTTAEIIDFEDIDEDKTSAVTIGAAWRFTAQEDGTFDIKTKIIPYFTNVTANQAAALYLYKNGAILERLWDRTFTGAFTNKYVTMKGFATVPLKKNDYIDIRGYSATSGTATLAADATFNSISISKNNTGTEKLFESAQVVAIYETSAPGHNVNTDALTNINYNTMIKDTHNAVTTGVGVWKFTAPMDGTYQIAPTLMFQAYTGWELGEESALHVSKNSLTSATVCVYRYLFPTSDASGSSLVAPLLSGSPVIMPLLEGEYVSIVAYQYSDAVLALFASAVHNRVSITRIK